MSKKSELPCKCRLTMPRGGTRATFRAESVEDAQRRALRILKKKALPKGWKLAVDGPAGACYPKADPAPRPFQVGDRVTGMGNLGTAITGKVIEYDPNCRRINMEYCVKRDTDGMRLWCLTDTLTLLEPAPQPKAEDDDWEGRCITLSVENLKLTDEVATLKAEVEGLTAVPPCPEDPNEAAMHRAAVKRSQETGEPFRVALLTLERDSARHGRDSWRQAQLNALGDLDLAQDKLDDIRALVRTWKILHKLDKPPESLSEAVAVVLDGAA